MRLRFLAERVESRQPGPSSEPVSTMAGADSSAGSQTNDEFDYAFDKDTREVSTLNDIVQGDPNVEALIAMQC